jgi:hypothetical protein
VQDPQMLELTKSEPLTLEEEYAMQRSWTQDPNKTTFILLDRTCTGADALPMVGDVNLYWNDHDDERVAEIEVCAVVARLPCMSQDAAMEHQAHAVWHVEQPLCK